MSSKPRYNKSYKSKPKKITKNAFYNNLKLKTARRLFEQKEKE
jgi:hypothetical protein